MWYGPIEPQKCGMLAASGGHALYWEVSGNPAGIPVLAVHGGPGGASTPNGRRWFDPRRYRIVQFDQRGCGRSLPPACIAQNTTADLVADIETLRQLLGVDRWVLMGRSWGTALALAYAESHPQRVVRLVLCGVFTARRSEIEWLYRGGAGRRFPAAWRRFCGDFSDTDRSDPIATFHARLTCGDSAIEIASARRWCEWEHMLATGNDRIDEGDDSLLVRARLQAHYFMHDAFMEEAQLIRHADRLKGIPGVVVQGQEDWVTPSTTAAELCVAWPDASLWLIPGAGHQSTDPDIMRALVETFDA